jgi:hypothetical protein
VTTPRGLRRYTAEVLAAAAQGVPLAAATVATVTAGGASDGHSLVTVEWNGATFPAPWLASYASIAVGQVVLVAFVGSQPVILGQIWGTPPVTAPPSE